MDTYTPPKAAQENARKVLEWKRHHSDEVRGMTPVGWARARQLASGKPVSLQTVSRMSQFARHQQNAKIAPEHEGTPWKDNGYVAWLGWGGTEGINWAKRIMESRKEKYSLSSTQIDMPPLVRGYARKIANGIDRNDLHEYGVERDSHVTVKYGLTTESSADVASVVSGFGPVSFQFGPLALFQNQEFDVLFVSVQDYNGDLQRLRDRISALPNEDEKGQERPYTPHMTIAYLKPGAGMKYLALPNPLDGRAFGGNTMQFSSASGNKTPIRLKEAGSTPTGIYGHGPSGLLSAPGMGQEDKKNMAQITKVEAGENHPSSHYLVVEDDQKPSTWHLRVMGPDGKPDRRLMGAAWAALTVGYRGNKYQGPKRTDALMKLRRIYRQMKVPLPEGAKKEASLLVFKDANGQYRWVSISSNPYLDRDGEYVSLKALQDDVARADADGDYGPLRFWHVDGADIGDCDFNAMHGKMLIESGTFRSPEIAQRVKEHGKDYRVSIAFMHPPDEPKDGIFTSINRKERSLVPERYVANTLTRFMVTEEDKKMDERKLKALNDLLGADVAATVLAAAAGTEKAATDAGITFKERTQEELAAMSADDLLEYALAKKEAEEAEAEKAAMQQAGDGEDNMAAMIEKAVNKCMTPYMQKMDGYMQKMAGMAEASSKKEADNALAEMREKIASVQQQVEQWKAVAQKAMTDAEKAAQVLALPPAARGFRPTEDRGNITETGKDVNGPTALKEFTEWATQGVAQG